MFDGVYQPFANLLGLKARDVNRAHTPTIITSAVTTLAEANVSDLGALIVSLTGALTMLVAGALGKEHIVVGDRVMMAEAGANFMWNGLRYVANPKSLEFVQDDAKDLGEALVVWNTDKASNILTNDKRDHRKSQQVKKYDGTKASRFGWWRQCHVLEVWTKRTNRINILRHGQNVNGYDRRTNGINDRWRQTNTSTRRR